MAIEDGRVMKKVEKKRYFEHSIPKETESTETSTDQKKPTKIVFTEEGEQLVVPIASDNDNSKRSATAAHGQPTKSGKRKHSKVDLQSFLNREDGEVPKRWYEHYDGYNTVGELVEMKDVEISELRKLCRAAFEAECRTRLKENPSDARWLQTAMEKGTSRDRASSGALLVQSNPFCNLQALETVIGMVKTSNKGHLDVMEALTELMINSLMPSFRKLIAIPLRGADWKNVQKQELDKELRETIYAHWHFEDQLRDLYFSFLSNMSVILYSGQEASKCKTVVHASKLFAEIPEKEAFLLTMLVNKLGDPSKKVAVKALYHLQQTVSKHPAMALVVTTETEKLLFRNNVSAMAQHYALSFLSTISVYSDFATCHKMINVCFAFFKILTEKGEINSRTMQSILACLRKTIGNMKREVHLTDVVKPELLNVIYRMIHLADISIACQGLSLLLEVTESKGAEQNRFYNTLYRKLLDPHLASTGPRISNIFFYILHRAMQNDPIPERAQAFVKRLLQVAFYFPPSRVCATLIVINKVMRKRRHLMMDGLPPEIAANKQSPERTDAIVGQESLDEAGDKKGKPAGVSRVKRYDAFCRSSEYACANYTLKYELTRYLCYFHPTVQKFAQSILSNDALTYYGDPLRDFSLTHFLERFAFKNPKKPKTKTDENGEEIEHWRPLGVLSKKGDYIATGSRALPVASLTKNQCTEDDQYIFQFLEQRRERMQRALEKKKARQKLKKAKGNDDDVDEEIDSDVDSLDDDEFDAYLDRLGVPGGQDDGANMDPEELDFMHELEQDMKSSKQGAGKKSASRKNAQAAEKEEDEENDLDDWDAVDGDANQDDDGEDDEGSEAELGGLDEDDEFSDGGSVSLEEDDGFDGGEIDEDDEEEEEEEEDEPDSDDEADEGPVMKKRKKSSSGNVSDRDFARKLKSSDMNSLFAAADDFSELLERSAAGAKPKKGAKNPIAGSHGTEVEVFNQDESSFKQLAWEQRRFSGNNRMHTGGKNRLKAKKNTGDRGAGRKGGRGGAEGVRGKTFGGGGRLKHRK